MVSDSRGGESQLEEFDDALQKNNKSVSIIGDPRLIKAVISHKALPKLFDIAAVSTLWEAEMGPALHSQTPNLLDANQQEQLQVLLDQYNIVFSDPQGLPPRRVVDHKIPIKTGVDPINVRPYRYPYLQKNEIEKQVAEMLSNGIIRPSNSPYFNPVILIKKKDGS